MKRKKLYPSCFNIVQKQYCEKYDCEFRIECFEKQKYELEKVRRYFYGSPKPDINTVIKESDCLEELQTLAKTIKLRVGKTFHETLVINEWDDKHIDIYQVLFQKDSEDDWKENK